MTNIKKKEKLFYKAYCFLLGSYAMSFHSFSFAYAEILQHDSSVEYKQAERLEYQQNRQGQKFFATMHAPLNQENLLDTLDVYALSPNAKLLLLPHMLSYAHFDIQDESVDWNDIITKASAKHNVAYNLIYAVIKTESNFISDALSSVGAQGAMQIMPETAKELGLTEPYNPSDNVDAGTRYLKEQLLRFKDLELALAAYNAGPGNVIKYKGIPPFKETQDFVKRVLSHM